MGGRGSKSSSPAPVVEEEVEEDIKEEEEEEDKVLEDEKVFFENEEEQQPEEHIEGDAIDVTTNALWFHENVTNSATAEALLLNEVKDDDEQVRYLVWKSKTQIESAGSEDASTDVVVRSDFTLSVNHNGKTIHYALVKPVGGEVFQLNGIDIDPDASTLEKAISLLHTPSQLSDDGDWPEGLTIPVVNSNEEKGFKRQGSVKTRMSKFESSTNSNTTTNDGDGGGDDDDGDSATNKPEVKAHPIIRRGSVKDKLSRFEKVDGDDGDAATTNDNNDDENNNDDIVDNEEITVEDGFGIASDDDGDDDDNNDNNDDNDNNDNDADDDENDNDNGFEKAGLGDDAANDERERATAALELAKKKALERSAKYDELIGNNAEVLTPTIELEQDTFNFVAEGELSHIRQMFQKAEQETQEKQSKEKEQLKRKYSWKQPPPKVIEQPQPSSSPSPPPPTTPTTTVTTTTADSPPPSETDITAATNELPTSTPTNESDVVGNENVAVEDDVTATIVEGEAVVETIVVPDVVPNLHGYHHGVQSAPQAEDLLSQNDGLEEEGRFLTRNTDTFSFSNVVVSVVFRQTCTHHILEQDEAGSVFTLNDAPLPDTVTTLTEVIAHLRQPHPYWPLSLTSWVDVGGVCHAFESQAPTDETESHAQPSEEDVIETENNSGDKETPIEDHTGGDDGDDGNDGNDVDKDKDDGDNDNDDGDNVEAGTTQQPKYFHGALTKDGAEVLLAEDDGLTETGRFLIRFSPKSTDISDPSSFVLSVVFKGMVTHHNLVKVENGTFVINGSETNENVISLDTAVEYLKHKHGKTWPLELATPVLVKD